jgi:enterochelin esterase family protein
MRVELVAPDWATHLLSDLTDWQRDPLPVGRLRPFDLPDDAYFEYAWLDGDGQRREDPANPHPRLNPWWPYACHVAGPAYLPDPDAEATAGAAPRGRTLRLEVDSRLLGQTRHALVYTPAGCGDRALPLVLFQDGKAYYGWGRVPQILDRLLARGEVAPAHLVFVPPRERTPEYFYNALYRDFLRDEMMPAVGGRVALDGRQVAWGASLGGLLSAQLAWESGGRFETVVAQSGAFLFSPDMKPGDPFHGGEDFRNVVVEGPQQNIRWYLECGTLEWLLSSNERLASALVPRAPEARLVTRHAGHNWVNWRNGIAAGLRFALGPAAAVDDAAKES